MTTLRGIARATSDDDLYYPGSTDDEVQIQLGRRELRTCESYEVKVGVFTQPSAFAVTLGDGSTVGALWQAFPPRTPFKLFIGGTLIQTGYTDSRTMGGAGAALQVGGRDVLQDIHDSYTPVEKTYTEKYHRDLILHVFEDAGMPTPVIHVSNEANRKAMALGRALPAPAKAKEEVTIPRPVQIKMGDTYYNFLKRVLDRAGLFFFAGTNGEYILTAPDKDQDPIYSLVHCPSDKAKRTTVTNFNISDSTIGRCSHYVVYARGGGKQFGRQKYKGGFPDKEMADYGYDRTRTFRDWHVQNDGQAETMARRKIADERRKGWRMSMTVVGHTTTSLQGKRAVWTPDTMVLVDSDELGLKGPYYLESVTYRRDGGGTTSTLQLIRPEDLEFGIEQT